MSEETMRKVDSVIRRIIDEQYTIARKHIEDNKDKMHAMAKALLEWETIDADQIDDIMAGKPPRRRRTGRRRADPSRPGPTPPVTPTARRPQPERTGRVIFHGASAPLLLLVSHQASRYRLACTGRPPASAST
jgi:hypothetical protein